MWIKGWMLQFILFSRDEGCLKLLGRGFHVCIQLCPVGLILWEKVLLGNSNRCSNILLLWGSIGWAKPQNENQLNKSRVVKWISELMQKPWGLVHKTCFASRKWKFEPKWSLKLAVLNLGFTKFLIKGISSQTTKTKI